MGDFFGVVAAGPSFFLSAWLLMLFAGIVGDDVGIRPFGYITSMVVTIALWLAVAPAAGAIARSMKKPKQLGALPGPGLGHGVLDDLVQFGAQGIGQQAKVGEVIGVDDGGHGERTGIGQHLEMDRDVAALG